MKPAEAGGHARKVAAGAAALACGPIMLASCAGASSPPRHSATGTSSQTSTTLAATGTTEVVSPTTTSTSGASASTGTSGSAGTSTTVAALATCLAMNLTVHLGPTNAGAGSVQQIVTFQNTGTAPCALYGYPGLQMLGPGGQAISTEVHRGSSESVPPVELTTVRLVVGGAASFAAGWADGTGYGNDQCPSSSQVRITPPNDANPITVSWAIAPYGGTTEHLECGEVTVSPVYAGSGPPPQSAPRS